MQALTCFLTAAAVIYLSSFHEGGLAGPGFQRAVLLIAGSVIGSTVVLDYHGVHTAMPIANAVMIFVVILLYRLHQIKPRR